MLATALDSVLSRTPTPDGGPEGTRWVQTRAGRIRVRDTGGTGPAVVMTPDGPNVIEHHGAVIDALAPHARVVCLEMPGFGFSAPAARYGHRLEQGAEAVLDVMDVLQVPAATLAFSCANGFYAIAVAKRAPARVRRLVLAQTPGLSAMHAWTARNVPKPLRVPVLGQALGRAARRKLAHTWYGIAMNDKPQRDAYRATAARALDAGACYCLAGVVQGLARTEVAALTGVTHPATLIWGDADRSHPHTRAESLHELLPHAQIRHLPDCGHYPDLERPEPYVELVKDTL